MKDIKLSKVKPLIEKGLGNKQIAKTLHTCAKEVGKIRIRLNLPHAKAIKRNLIIERIRKLSESNLSDSKIGKILNRNHRTIGHYRKIGSIPAFMPELTYISQYDRTRGYMIRNTKFMAKRRGISFNLKFDDFELPEYCPILNIKLTYRGESNGNHFSHASMDRIDNSKGYVKDNIMVVSRLANSMKSEANFEELQQFCFNILKLINSYKNQGARGSITDIFSNFKLRKFSLDS